jgi:hypothetical protein
VLRRLAMEHVVKRGIGGGILGGLFSLLITVPWEPLLGVEGPGLRMALPTAAGFALFGAWFASIPCLADEEEAQREPASRVEKTHDRLAA